MAKHLLQKEAFAGIQEAQAGLSRLLIKAERNGTFYRVLKNNKPIGVLLSNSTWESVTEDLAALTSPAYLRNIATARREKRRMSLAQVKRQLKLK